MRIARPRPRGSGPGEKDVIWPCGAHTTRIWPEASYRIGLIRHAFRIETQPNGPRLKTICREPVKSNQVVSGRDIYNYLYKTIDYKALAFLPHTTAHIFGSGGTDQQTSSNSPGVANAPYAARCPTGRLSEVRRKGMSPFARRAPASAGAQSFCQRGHTICGSCRATSVAGC